MSQAMQLHSHTVTGTGDGPHLLITGGVHGDEFEPMMAIRQLRRTLVPRDMRGRVTLVPVVNEAAYRRLSRTAEDGLDLARTCPGCDTGSVTQRTAAALAALIRQADLYIDLHTGGNVYDILPLAGYTLHPDAAILERQRRMAMAFNLPLVWGTTPNLNGRSLSVARDAGVPAIYAEWGGEGRLRPAGVADYLDGCLHVMAEFGMIDRPRPAPRVRHWVEDPTDGSGHLQVQNPAPCEGLFTPIVRLGQVVRGDETLGWVRDVIADREEPVQAAHDGLVMLLRTFPFVAKGDAAAAIVDIHRFGRPLADAPSRRS